MRDNQVFYTQPSDVHTAEGCLLLRGDEAHHCTHVLRKKAGDEFYVVDGVGTEWTVVLDGMGEEGVRCRILEFAVRPRELAVDITLGVALLKGDHFDFVVEKATELGVARIVPMTTARCVMAAGGRKAHRWRRIAMEAMKQSRRSVCPAVDEVTAFEDVLAAPASGVARIICHEASDNLWNPAAVHAPAVWILVGPEGGFTETEVERAGMAGWDKVSLGLRRLKAETAAICALSAFSFLHSP